MIRVIHTLYEYANSCAVVVQGRERAGAVGDHSAMFILYLAAGLSLRNG